MSFEQDFKNRLHAEVRKRIEDDFNRRWNGNNRYLEEELQNIKFDSIENAYSIYLENVLRDIPKNELFKLFGEFEQAISPKALIEWKGKIELEEQEKTYIKYKEQCGFRKYRWNKSCCRNYSTKNFIRKIRLTIDWCFLQIVEREAQRNSQFEKQYEYVKKLVTGEIFNVQEELDQKIESAEQLWKKNDCQAPQGFQGWGNLEGCPKAVFAVKKEHEMKYFKKYGHIILPTDTSMNFEETVCQAIQNRQNTFEYYNHSYVLKKSEEETIYML